MAKPSGAITKADETIHAMAQHMRAYTLYGRGWNWNAFLLSCAALGPAVIHLFPNQRAKYLDIFVPLVLLPLLIIVIRIGIEFASGWRLEKRLRALFQSDTDDGWQTVSSAAAPSLLDILPCATEDHSDLLPKLAALLNKLLKPLSARDAMVVTDVQRDVLHELIMPIRQNGNAAWYATEIPAVQLYQLRPTIVGALALLGNSSSISVLERFAAKTDDEELQESALHSVERIRERMHHCPEEMLRAGVVPERPNTLLRAARPGSLQNDDPQQLLRADHATVPASLIARHGIGEGSET